MMTTQKNIVNFLFTLLFITFITSAIDPSYIFKKDSNATISIGCFDIGNAPCNSATACQITINHANGTNLITNKSMAFAKTQFIYNLTVNDTGSNGEYGVITTCQGSGYNASSTFSYEINPVGIRANEVRSGAVKIGIWFFVILGTLLIAMSFFNPKIIWKFTLIILGFLSYLTSINIIAILMSDEVVNPNLVNLIDFTTAISFYIYEFSLSLLFILWIFSISMTIHDYVSKKKIIKEEGKWQT